MMTLTKVTRLRQAVVVTGAVIMTILLVGYGRATIPNASGQIDACVSRTGALRVIDTEAGKRCDSRERPLSWPSSSTGAPKAYGFVVWTEDSQGTPVGADVDESRSMGLTDAMVRLVPDTSGNGTRQFCFDVPFEVDNISVTSASVARVVLSAVPDDCAGGANNFSVYGTDAQTGLGGLARFYIVVR